jgi:hypothetical protein
MLLVQEALWNKRNNENPNKRFGDVELAEPHFIPHIQEE